MKKFLSIILTALVLFCFTACGSNESTTENPEDTLTTTAKELRFIEVSKTEVGYNTEIIYVDRETRVMYMQRYTYFSASSAPLTNSGMSVLYGPDGLPLIYEGELEAVDKNTTKDTYVVTGKEFGDNYVHLIIDVNGEPHIVYETYENAADIEIGDTVPKSILDK